MIPPFRVLKPVVAENRKNDRCATESPLTQMPEFILLESQASNNA